MDLRATGQFDEPAIWKLRRRLQKLPAANFIGWQIKTALRRLGMEFPRTPDLVDFLATRNVDLVLDVGANLGQFGRRLRRLGYREQIVSFEPINQVFGELHKLTSRDGKWSCYNYALGDKSGEATLNVSRQTEYSSLLAQRPSTRSQLESSASGVERAETIKVFRLDDIPGQLSGQRVFMKIDTQGFEKHVLDGARTYLQRVVGVQLEIAVVPLYDEIWTLADAITYMGEAGFVLGQISSGALRTNDRTTAAEVDVLFRRLDAGDA